MPTLFVPGGRVQEMENNYKLMLMQMLLAGAGADAEPAHLPKPVHRQQSIKW